MKWGSLKKFIDTHFDDDDEIFLTAGFSMCEISRVDHGCNCIRLVTKNDELAIASNEEIEAIYGNNKTFSDNFLEVDND